MTSLQTSFMFHRHKKSISCCKLKLYENGLIRQNLGRQQAVLSIVEKIGWVSKLFKLALNLSWNWLNMWRYCVFLSISTLFYQKGQSGMFARGKRNVFQYFVRDEEFIRWAKHQAICWCAFFQCRIIYRFSNYLPHSYIVFLVSLAIFLCAQKKHSSFPNLIYANCTRHCEFPWRQLYYPWLYLVWGQWSIINLTFFFVPYPVNDFINGAWATNSSCTLWGETCRNKGKQVRLWDQVQRIEGFYEARKIFAFSYFFPQLRKLK